MEAGRSRSLETRLFLSKSGSEVVLLGDDFSWQLHFANYVHERSGSDGGYGDRFRRADVKELLWEIV